MRKHFGLLAMAAVALSVAVQPGLCKTTKITFAGNMYGMAEQRAWFNKVVNDFNKTSTDVKVELVQGIDGQKLAIMSAAGKTPDVVQFDRFQVAYWARAGLFTPLESYLPKSINIKRDFIPATVQEATWKGKLYALPMTTDIRGLFWNKRLLKEAGLDGNRGPRTWAEFNDFAKKLTIKSGDGKIKQAGFVPWDGNWYEYAWTWTFGGDYYNNSTGKPTLNHPKNIEAFKWMGDFVKSIYGTTTMPSKDFIKEGQAMTVQYHGVITNWRKANKTVDQWVWGGEMPHPEGGKNGTWAGGMCYVIPAASKHKAAASKFLAYLAKNEVMDSFYKETKELPPTTKGLADLKSGMELLEQILIAQLPEANHRRPFSDILRNFLSEAQTAVINQRKSPEAALNDAQTNALRQYPSLWKEKVVYSVK